MDGGPAINYSGRVFRSTLHPVGLNALNLGGMGAGPHPQPTGTGGYIVPFSFPALFAF
jgi:hypothetical protein